MEKSIKKTKGDNEDYPLLEGAVLNGAGVVKVIKKTKGEHKQIVQNFAKLCCRCQGSVCFLLLCVVGAASAANRNEHGAIRKRNHMIYFLGTLLMVR